MTEVRLLGIGNDGLGLDCIAAKACCTASCRTSKIIEINFVITISIEYDFSTVKLYKIYSNEMHICIYIVYEN